MRNLTTLAFKTGLTIIVLNEAATHKETIVIADILGKALVVQTEGEARFLIVDATVGASSTSPLRDGWIRGFTSASEGVFPFTPVVAETATDISHSTIYSGREAIAGC